MAYYGPHRRLIRAAGVVAGPAGARLRRDLLAVHGRSRRATRIVHQRLVAADVRLPRAADAPTGELVAFVEAAIGLALVAPPDLVPAGRSTARSRGTSCSSACSRSAPTHRPSPVVMITRTHRLRGARRAARPVERWQQWFAELEETHTSPPVLVFYRSQQPDHSWVIAAGAVMDAAALMRSPSTAPRDVQADLAIRAGYLALRRDRAVLPHRVRRAPAADRRRRASAGERFDDGLHVLEAAGVPLVEDRDQAWRDFNGWRVNSTPYRAALAPSRSLPPSVGAGRCAPLGDGRAAGRTRRADPGPSRSAVVAAVGACDRARGRSPARHDQPELCSRRLHPQFGRCRELACSARSSGRRCAEHATRAVGSWRRSPARGSGVASSPVIAAPCPPGP